MADKKIINTYTTYVPPDDLFTPTEQVAQCCVEVDVDVCADVGKTEIYVAADIEDWEENLEELRKKYPQVQNIISETVGPDGPCGHKYTEWGNPSCCDGVAPITWDDNNSVEVLAPLSFGTVHVTGGKSPYTWSVRGKDFSFSELGTVRDATTNEPWIAVFSGADACGTAAITVTDDCSVAQGSVRSDVGKWDDCVCVMSYTIDLSPGFGAASLSNVLPVGCGIRNFGAGNGCADPGRYLQVSNYYIWNSNYNTWSQYLISNGHVCAATYDDFIASITCQIYGQEGIPSTPDGSQGCAEHPCKWICE